MNESKSKITRVRRGSKARRLERLSDLADANILSNDSRNYIRRDIPVYEILSDEGLSRIEEVADVVLEEIGVEISGDEEALSLWQEAGADVDGTRVRFPKGLCRKLIKTIPADYVQHARNSKRNVTIGGKNTVFAPVYGPPFIYNLDEGRRYATIEDFRNFVKMTYMSDPLHHSGGTLCEPVDIGVNIRHLDMVYSHIRYSDKPFMGSVTHLDRAKDTVKMAKLVFGKDFVNNNCVITSLINVNSPLTYDATMLGALKVYARAHQSCIVSPFVLSGAMSPVTVAGTLVQLLAEVLVGLSFTQLCRPGTPAVFGSFASSMSMQSGAPTFGMAEPALILYAAAQLARRLGVPFRSGGALCASKIADAQSAYESAQTLLPGFLAGVNFMLHSAGWLEGGLVSGYEKFIIDVDQLVVLHRFAKGISLDENGIALDALREVGPGKHFLGCDHTQRNFKTAFYNSPISDNNSFEQWQLEGSLDIVQRANKYYKKLLASYQAPLIDDSIDESLLEFMVKRKQEIGKGGYGGI